MKIYISGKISKLVLFQNGKEDKKESLKCAKRNFQDAEFKIWELYGIEAYKNSVNPLNLKPFLCVKCWFCYMITDLYHLRKCTHIAMQTNWTKSKGAVIEYFFAKLIFKLKVIWL